MGTLVLPTPRLDLHPLPLPVLEALLARDWAAAQALVPFAIGSQSFLDDDYVLGLRRRQLQADPGELPWLYRAAVLRSTGEVGGRAGFHAPPDADGTVELGYRVAPAWRRRGLALEIAVALLDWAAQQGAVRCLGCTTPDNVASQAVLARLGFVRTGEQVDEIDGLELVHTLELAPPRASASPLRVQRAPR